MKCSYILQKKRATVARAGEEQSSVGLIFAHGFKGESLVAHCIRGY